MYPLSLFEFPTKLTNPQYLAPKAKDKISCFLA